MKQVQQTWNNLMTLHQRLQTLTQISANRYKDNDTGEIYTLGILGFVPVEKYDKMILK